MEERATPPPRPTSKAAAGPAREEPLAAGAGRSSAAATSASKTRCYKIAESLRKTDPDRADLLLRAIGKSKEDRISQQMTDLVQLLRDNKQLGDAIERQGDVVTNCMRCSICFSAKTGRKSSRKNRHASRGTSKKSTSIIAKEKANRADTERGAPADEVAGQQKKIADQTGNLGKQMAKDDAAKQAKSRSRQAQRRQTLRRKTERRQTGRWQAERWQTTTKTHQDGKPTDGKPGDRNQAMGSRVMASPRRENRTMASLRTDKPPG